MSLDRTGGGQRRRRGAWGAVITIVIGLAASRPVSAATDPAPRSVQLTLALEVHSDAPALDRAVLRRALEEELGREVVTGGAADSLPRITVDLRAARGELAVRYDEAGRRPLVRVIPAPATPEATIRTVAWLAGNLVRDQASDLVGSAQPAPPRSPPAVDTPPPAVPPAGPAPPAAVAVAQPNPRPAHYVFFTASVFFPLATNAGDPDVRTHLSLNLVYGRIGVLDRGVQLGMANTVTGAVGGGQLGLLFNKAGGDVDGMQVAGATNVALGNVRGMQLAFAANRTSGDLDGVQVAAVNSTQGHVRGAQTGFVNSAGDVDGLQAGLVNVGARVHGVQLGLVNVSDDIDGLPIGLINVSRTGGVHPALWTSGTTQLALGVKFATRKVYTLFSAATHDDSGLRLYGPGLALGMRVPIRRLIVESDVGGTYLFGGPTTGVSRQDGMRDDVALASWRVVANVELHRRLTLFAGAALTTRFRFYQSTVSDWSYEFGPDLFAGVQL